MCGAFRAYGEERRCVQGNRQLERPRRRGRIIFKCIFRKWDGLDLSVSG
jgi:hypothetical protein